MNLHVIINPRSKLARNEQALAIIKGKFGAFLHGITETTCAQDAVEVARYAARNDSDTLVVAGGDGTINAVLHGLAATGVALGVIPGGTANDLASLYELPSDVGAACDVILRRRLRAIDLIGVNGSYFVTGGGLGLPTKVAAHANAIKSRGGLGAMLHGMLGSRLYVMSAICALLRHSYENTPLAIRWDRGSRTADCLSFTVNNQPFLGRHFFMSPQAANNDGLFDVCLIENSQSRVQIAAALTRALRGSHITLPSVTSWRAQELVVRAEKPLPFFADGEQLQTADVFTIKIFPQSLNLIVPAENTRPEIRASRERNNHALYS